MHLTRWWQRVGLVILGVGLLSVGGVGAALKWSDVALAAFIAAGVLVVLGALAGAMPKGSIKDGFEWPDVDKHPRVEKIEAEIAALLAQNGAEVATLRAEVAAARREAKDATDFLIDYILAHEPPPEDEEGPMTDEERLLYMERMVNELSSEITGRYFTGEYYDDGVDVTELEQGRDEGQAALDKEERRQAARRRFGLSVTSAPGGR